MAVSILWGEQSWTMFLSQKIIASKQLKLWNLRHLSWQTFLQIFGSLFFFFFLDCCQKENAKLNKYKNLHSSFGLYFLCPFFTQPCKILQSWSWLAYSIGEREKLLLMLLVLNPQINLWYSGFAVNSASPFYCIWFVTGFSGPHKEASPHHAKPKNWASLDDKVLEQI